MVYFNEPVTLTKIANYPGNLEDDVGSFNFEAEKLSGDSRSIEFGLYQEKPHQYLLIASCRTDGQSEEFNLVVSITSDSFDTNNLLEKKFGEKLKVELRNAPPCLSERMYSFGKEIFPHFKKYGNSAMQILKKRLK